jgi:predicted ArsR family transcriptional regulator
MIWNQRFFSSTRGRIITLLRRSSHTVEEMAQALDLTHTAVRTHLAALERDGLVQHHNERRGSGKPSAVFELAPAAAYLFPRAYSQLLSQLLEVLPERLPAEEVETLLREVGRHMALEWKTPRGDLGVRLEGAVEVLNELQRCTKQLSLHLALPFVRKGIATMLKPPLGILSGDGE